MGRVSDEVQKEDYTSQKHDPRKDISKVSIMEDKNSVIDPAEALKYLMNVIVKSACKTEKEKTEFMKRVHDMANPPVNK